MISSGAQADAIRMETIALYLWSLLDNIDTLDDACRGDNLAFRNNTRREQRRRFKVGSTDGYTVEFDKEISETPRLASSSPLESQKISIELTNEEEAHALNEAFSRKTHGGVIADFTEKLNEACRARRLGEGPSSDERVVLVGTALAEAQGRIRELEETRKRIDECRRKDLAAIQAMTADRDQYRAKMKAASVDSDRYWNELEAMRINRDSYQDRQHELEAQRDDYLKQWQAKCGHLVDVTQDRDRLKREIGLGKQWAVHPLEVRATMLTGADSTLDAECLEAFRHVLDEVRGLRTFAGVDRT